MRRIKRANARREFERACFKWEGASGGLRHSQHVTEAGRVAQRPTQVFSFPASVRFSCSEELTFILQQPAPYCAIDGGLECLGDAASCARVSTSNLNSSALARPRHTITIFTGTRESAA